MKQLTGKEEKIYKEIAQQWAQKNDKRIFDDLDLFAEHATKLLEGLFYLQFTEDRRWQRCEGYESAAFDDFLSHRMNMHPKSYQSQIEALIDNPEWARKHGIHEAMAIRKTSKKYDEREEVREKLKKADKESMKKSGQPLPPEERMHIVRGYMRHNPNKQKPSARKATERKLAREIESRKEVVLESKAKDEQIEKLKNTVVELKPLKTRNAELEAENARLKKRVAELEAENTEYRTWFSKISQFAEKREEARPV